MLPVSHMIAKRASELTLSTAERSRYSRHLLLPEVGEEGQRRLKAARVLVIGAGGLGSPVSLYLAAAGVGRLGLVEFDTVDRTNLQRQVLYGEGDAGQPKLEAACRRLSELNSGIEIVPHAVRLDASNVMEIFTSYDIVVDGTDNFPTRYLANDACVLMQKPYVFGSIFRFDGQASLFYAPHGPCYRCLFPAPPPPGQVPSCAEGGVLGVLPAQVGSIQANEALKLVLGIGRPLLGRLLTIDAMDQRIDEFSVCRDAGCPVCGDRPAITTVADSATSTCASSAASRETSVADAVIDVHALAALRARNEAHRLVDVRSPGEAAICRIEESLLIPLPELERRLGELPRATRLVVYCKSGARSARAVAFLRERGFTNCVSLVGGILAWIEAYAPELPTY